MTNDKLKFMPQEEGFLGIEKKYLSGPEDAKAIIVPFGLEASVCYGGGTRVGPAAIIKASHQLEFFDEEHWCETYQKFGVATLEAPAIGISIPDALNQLEKIVQEVLDQDKFPLILGGEHSITAGGIRPFVRKYPNLAILHFDAHADLRDGFEGEHYSHAAALRRVMDNPISTLISCGIRNISASEIPYLEENKDRITIHWAKDLKKWNIEEIVAPLKDRPVFITFDVDGFDSSLMQATGTPEPGGIFWQDAMDIIKAAANISNIVGADIVELAPIKQLHSCDFLAAKLAYKILGYSLNK
ncbi:MAG: agmatinase [Lentimonas sp.]|jgi:agmatinase